jgi:hypothetical protein
MASDVYTRRVHTAAVCVCVHGAATTRGSVSPEPLYRPKTACVSVHTHGAVGRSSLSPSLSCIQNNYIQHTKYVINRVCIQNVYVGGGGCAGS